MKIFDGSKLLAVACVGAAASLCAPAASAHDVVMRATPADKSVVSEFPRSIELEFSGMPKDTFNTIAVTNQDTGQQLFSGEPTLDKQLVRISVPEGMNPGPGHYKVGFQITSSDGHATRGMTTFEVAGSSAAAQAPASTSSSASPAGEEASTSSSVNTVALLAVGMGILAAVAVLTIVIRNRKK